MDATDFLPNEASIAAIRQKIAEYEVERAAVHRRVLIRTPLFLGLLLIVVAVAAWSLNGFADPYEKWVSTPQIFLYVLGASALLPVYAWARRPASLLQRSFRERLLPDIFGFIEGVRYARDTEPGTFERLPAQAVGPFNRKSFDDVVTGSYGGFAFELYEAHLHQKSGKSDSTSFRGVIVAFETETPFPGLVVATRKGNQLVSFFRGMFGGAELEPIASGVPALDEIYDFRSDNPDAARPLVQGRLALALQWLAEAWPEEPARIALQEHNGFLLLPSSKNFFELPDISVPLDYRLHVQPIIADMASLLATASLVRKIGDADAPTPN